MQAIKHLHPDVVASVHARALFSKQEETVMGKVVSVSLLHCPLTVLMHFINENVSIFNN